MRELRFICDECGKIFEREADIPQWPRPNGSSWGYCDRCDSAESFTNICDEPGCNHKATCGFPDKDGYRRTCGEHYQEAKRSIKNE